jgi:hypothetical protein
MAVSPKSALLLSGLASLVILGSGMGIIGPALPVYERSFSLTTAGSGLLISTLWVGCLLAVLGMYFKGGQITPRPGLALLVVGCILLAVAPLWPVALAGALVFGLGYGILAALFNPRILVAFGARGASRLGMLNAVFSLGAILAPFGFALTSGDLRPVFWTMALCAALAWVFSGSVGLTGATTADAPRGFRLHLPILGFALLAIGIEASLAGLGPTALIRAGVSEERAAALLSLFFVAALAARIGLVLVAHRLPDFAIFLFALLWATACALGAALISPGVFFPLIGIAAGLFFQGEYVTATRKMGADPRVSPIIIGVGLVGAIFSPLVYARAMDGLGSHGFFWLVAGVAGLTSIAALASYRQMMR